MKGFIKNCEAFSGKQGKPSTKTPKPKVAKVLGCSSCGLSADSIVLEGQGKKGILILTDCPTYSDSKRGYLFSDAYGKAFDDLLLTKGIDLVEDCWFYPVVRCLPKKEGEPTLRNLKCCESNWKKVIEQVKPSYIWIMGEYAFEAYYMYRDWVESKQRPSLSSVVGWKIQDKKYNCLVFPFYSVDYIYGSKNSATFLSLFNLDLDNAIESIYNYEKPVFPNFEENIELVTKFERVKEILNCIIKIKPLITFDYETSTIKPYNKGHLIWSVGVCFDGTGYSFPLHYPDVFTSDQISEIERLWIAILDDEQILKVNQNIKFEELWGRGVLGTRTQGWVHDTQLMAHVLDSRKKLTGLKTQAFLRYGVEGYEKDTKQYMETVDSNGHNTLYKMPLDRLLEYNAMDAIITMKLYEDQSKEFWDDDTRSTDIFDVFLDGILELSEAENNGITLDTDHYKVCRKQLTEDINFYEKELKTSNEANLFRKTYNKELDYGSPKDLRALFYDILKYNGDKKTKTGLNSVDVETLSEFDLPYAKQLLALRKLLKLRDTYLAQFDREITQDGKLHPSFLLHVAESGRSSSQAPNFQNIPVRDEEGKRVTRGGIIPSKGNHILESDYKAIEVRIMACYTKDPVLERYIKDPKTDMHRDQAEALFILKTNQITKDLRFYTKNNFVFPEFYGSYFVACGRDLWDNCSGLKLEDGTTIAKHLKAQGIKNQQDFIEHVKSVETKFWDKLHVSRMWREKVLAEYQKKGYIETFLGFRRKGYLKNNQVFNSPIQGTAFHCLLWSFSRVGEYLRKNGLKTKLIGQIHDSMITDLHIPETALVKDIIDEFGCNAIREKFDWITVPLEIEHTVYTTSWFGKDELDEE